MIHNRKHNVPYMYPYIIYNSIELYIKVAIIGSDS